MAATSPPWAGACRGRRADIVAALGLLLAAPVAGIELDALAEHRSHLRALLDRS